MSKIQLSGVAKRNVVQYDRSKHIFTNGIDNSYPQKVERMIQNSVTADDIIVIVEANGEKGEGLFLAYGVTNGLWKATQTKSSADNNALTTYEFASRDQMEERYSEYVVLMTDYDGTKTALIATESV